MKMRGLRGTSASLFFGGVDPNRRYRPQRAADAIKKWVVEKGMELEDRLPAEAELFGLLGMSKGMIREAIPHNP